MVRLKLRLKGVEILLLRGRIANDGDLPSHYEGRKYKPEQRAQEHRGGKFQPPLQLLPLSLTFSVHTSLSPFSAIARAAQAPC
jgi:hypothetical protein